MTTAEPTIAACLAALPAIDLDELVSRADLQTRSARKYVVDRSTAGALIDALAPTASCLEIAGGRVHDYETLYFDTPDLALYLDTAHRRPRRFKVRIRTYSTLDHPMLELKTKNGRGATVKFRRPHTSDDPTRLDADARSWIDGIVARGLTPLLEPSLTTMFGRATIVDDGGMARYTFDEGVQCVDARDGRRVGLEAIVVECKSTGTSAAGDRWLWRHGVRPTTLSKYCTGLAALHPDLPANHWHRTLRTHFAA